jgi:hypothetical protein
MNRRLAIKYFLVVSGGSVLLPACLNKNNKEASSIKLTNIKVDKDQENLLEELTNVIIPKTDTPGAKDVSAHLFTLMMVDDCFKKEDQQKFESGLKQFSEMAEKQFQKSFAQGSKEQKEELLQKIEKGDGIPEDVSSFYKATRRLTLQAYLTSQYYMTNIQKYKQVPGPVFRGCVAVKQA